MKKVLALLLALLMLAALAGCGSQTPAPTQAPTAAPTEAPKATASASDSQSADGSKSADTPTVTSGAGTDIVEKTDDGKNNPGLIIGICCAAVLLAGTCIFLVMRKKK